MIFVLSTMANQAARCNPAHELDALIDRTANGEQDAFALLYQRTNPAVYGLALSYLKNSAEAEDIAQDTFVQIWHNAHRYQHHGKPMAWILTIARNLSLMRIRKQNHLQDLPQDVWESLAIESPHLTTEDRAVLTAAFGVLSDQERRIILLHAVSGLKHREIADLLELPLTTVLSKYHRALKKLKNTLQGDENQ